MIDQQLFKHGIAYSLKKKPVDNKDDFALGYYMGVVAAYKHIAEEHANEAEFFEFLGDMKRRETDDYGG